MARVLSKLTRSKNGLAKARLSAGVNPKDIIKRVESKELVFTEAAQTAPKTDADYRQIYMRMVLKLYLMAQALEDKILDDTLDGVGPNVKGRDVYALMTIYSQEREVLNDLRSLRDLSGQARLLIDSYIQRAFKKIVILFSDQMQIIRRDIRNHTSGRVTKALNSTIEDMLAVISKDMQGIYDNLEKEIISFLTENK